MNLWHTKYFYGWKTEKARLLFDLTKIWDSKCRKESLAAAGWRLISKRAAC